MKDIIIGKWDGVAERVSFCSQETEQQTIEIDGQTLVPNEDTAYVEFCLAHAFPVQNLHRAAMMPEVVLNSYGTLRHKVFNFAHMMRSYAPEKYPKDVILGTVVAVEFMGPPPVEGDWDLNATYGVRAVAAMHKAAENVIDVLTTWFTGEEAYRGFWSVSIENQFRMGDCGFLVRAGAPGVAKFVESTPVRLRDLGWTYVDCSVAPLALKHTLNNAQDDEREKRTSTRIVRQYQGRDVVLMMGGLNGQIRFRGVGLAPKDNAQEKEAHIRTMMASEAVVDAGPVLGCLTQFMQPKG